MKLPLAAAQLRAVALRRGALPPWSVSSSFMWPALLNSASTAAFSRSSAASSSLSRAAACCAWTRAAVASARSLSRRGSCGSLSEVGWRAGSCALELAVAGEAWVTASSFAAAVAFSRRASSRKLAARFSCLFRFLRSALDRAGGAPSAASGWDAELSS